MGFSSELRCKHWRVESKAQSRFFAEPKRFLSGAAELDCMRLMRAIRDEWRVQEPFCFAGSEGSTKSQHGAAGRP